ncbi:hypothetical protein M422DRAFT_35218 [Sphaerobolus stellatus SS14]|uniref:P-loop containing nucleoside triphosphate hydrolase protein n=1 Tax=Sphaerobolus stellatus (strain SS14) TaxID=990650 RepID=A0A0C9V9J2_SPHS4|nr:hypothetical protein M422DRAFT_35218 [Sphaerobolus stellatus SS14]
MVHGSPVDDANGGLLWALIATLTAVGIVTPLITPRQYITVDPTHTKTPSPQQTASPLSILLFSWLDGLVWRATKVKHVPMDELPTLPDTSYTSILSGRAFSNIDPFAGDTILPINQRHIFWGLLRTYRTDYILITISMVLQAVASLISPFALQNLLKYLQGDGVEVRPWVWVFLLFVAPGTNSILTQQYYRLYTRAMVHLEVVLTQLVLEHALRIRVVAEPEGGANNNTPTPTPRVVPTNLPSTDGDETDMVEGEESTLTGSSASVNTSTSTVVPPASGAKSKNLVGRMNNLISSDLKAIGEGAEFIQPLVLGPCLFIGCVIFLYILLGWSAFVGVGGMIIQLPVPIWLAKLLQSTTKMVATKSDSRVDAATETMSVVRMVKLFGWELKMSAQLDKKREEELEWVWKSRMYNMAITNINFILPMLNMLLTFATYTLILRRPLDAATVFTALTVFSILQDQVRRVFFFVPAIIRGKVSLDRINDFITNTELLDVYTPESEASIALSSQEASGDIGFRSARFSWSVEADSGGAVTPSRRRFRLDVQNELLFKEGKINIIVGPTASGKTSMLMALLGEMHFMPYSPNSWFNLPRAGGNNIVFGATFEEERYKKVIHQCGLTRDLSLFDAGDSTEVGEKDLTLSARAIYSRAEIIILDDVLSALDVHTSKWILEKCFLGDLVKGRTLIMVTHNVSLAGPHADFVVSMGSDGRVLAQGSFSDVLSHNDKLRRAVADDRKEVEKLVVEEETGVGHLSWASLKMYFQAFGGRWPTLFWVAFWSATFFECIVEVFQQWFLGQWATQYEEHSPEEVNVPFYLGGYAFLVLLMLFAYTIAQIGLALGTVNSARTIHKSLIDSVLATTLRWLDKTPTSRVITRCTQDISSIDSRIPQILSEVFRLTVLIIVRFVAIIILTPIFGIMGLGVMALGIIVGHLYIKAQLSVQREQDKAKSPVMGHFQSTIEGIISIRAYGAQAKFKLNSMKKIDNYTRAALINWDLRRWIAIRVDALGNLFSSCLAAYFVYGSKKVTAANSGFELSMVVAFGSLVLYWVRSVNRIETYEHEKKPTADGVPPAYWPSSGSLRVEKLSARYSQDGPRVLQDISFEIQSGERVGIVGRTGSGKSSLTLSLLRLIVTEGNVYYDGQLTSAINLDALRSQITIIPQIPELLSGTLRQNLDPFEQHDDAILNNALASAGLFSLQAGDEESRMTLDSAISRGGGNLSVGQRQIIALARAMVRESKLLILDEATSAIDYKTDAIIQQSLRHELQKGVTVLTVAHRLQTIMDSDKIMVLDAGRIVEFNKPKELLKNPSGFLRSLVDESGDKDALYAAAGASP